MLLLILKAALSGILWFAPQIHTPAHSVNYHGRYIDCTNVQPDHPDYDPCFIEGFNDK